jgi:hypothetical protein
MGPTYYMRLKHMVKDKINYRARGPNQQLTRQPVQGRANDGGLRVGEMERDGICAHGLAYFLNESFLVRGDEYYMAVCNKTGAIAIYNEARNLFLSPYSDGPIHFHTNPDGTMNIKNLSKFGRSFSLLRIPYSFKLLIQELQVMNVQMRIITDENVDQLLSMSYSNNINKLLHNYDERNIESTNKLIKDYVKKMANMQSKTQEYLIDSIATFQNNLEEGDVSITPPYVPSPNVPISPPYAPSPNAAISPPYAPSPNAAISPPYAPSPNVPVSPPYAPSPVLNMPLESQAQSPTIGGTTSSILEVENEPKEEEKEKDEKEKAEGILSNDSGEKKVIDIEPETISDSTTKKIII